MDINKHHSPENITDKLINKIKTKLNNVIENNSVNIYNDLEDQSTISQNDIKTILHNIQNNSKQTPDNTPLKNVYNEIEFFNSNDINYPSIFKLLSANNSITAIETLKTLLSNPETDIQELIKRQNLIKSINNNLNDNQKTELENFKKYEKNLYWFIKPFSTELSEMLNSIYFTKLANIIDLSKLNNDNRFMNYYYTFLMIISPLWGMFSPVVFFIMPYLATKYFFKLDMPFKQYLKTLKATLFGDNIFNSIKQVLQVFMLSQVGSLMSGGAETKQNLSFYAKFKLILVQLLNFILSSNAIRYIYMFFVVSGYFWSLYNSYCVSRNYYRFIKFIHNKIAIFHRFINLVSNLSKNMSDNCPKDLESLKPVINLILKKRISQDLLSTETANYFSKSYNIMSNKGTVLTFFHKISKEYTQEELLTLTRFVSLNEIYFNLHKQLITTNKFTATNYITNSTKPVLKINNMVNPIITDCVPNSINLGGITNDDDVNNDDNNDVNNSVENDIEKNLLLSGPNGSGKSTFLKNIMTSVILAQTTGFAPCDNVELTPFTYLSTYLNIPDCIGKESLFQAEMSRCHKHLTNLKELDLVDKGFSLNIMDEIFVSTNYYEGISGAYAVMKNVVKYQNAINIITTHFDKCLEKPINGYIYKHFTLSDSLENDYKLLDGVNDKHCALDLLEKYGFDDDLVLEAKEKYKEIKSGQITNSVVSSNETEAELTDTEAEAELTETEDEEETE